MKKNLCVCASLLTFLLVGCYTPHFLPNTAPTPMFEKAGNVRIAGYTGTNSYDLHLAVSPIDHIGLIGAGSLSNSSKKDKEKPDNESQWTHSHKYYEGAIGYYFSPFNFKKDLMKIEVYPGYGWGKVNGSLNIDKNLLGYLLPTTRVDANYIQYYLQLNTAISERTINAAGDLQLLEYGTIIRISKTKISDFSRYGQSLEVSPMEGIFTQVGLFGTAFVYNWCGFTGQAGWLFPVGDALNLPSYSPLYITIGINFSFW